MLFKQNVEAKEGIVNAAKAAAQAANEAVAKQQVVVAQAKLNKASKAEIAAEEATLATLKQQASEKEQAVIKAQDEYNTAKINLEQQQLINNQLSDRLALQDNFSTLVSASSSLLTGMVAALAQAAMVMKVILTFAKAETREQIKSWAIEKKKLITEKMSAA